jgi:uncharacterized membrane protein YfcA
MLAWLIAPLIGLSLAMFGAGGGMMTVPILHYAMGLPMKEAVASSLWVVVAVSLMALAQQRVWKDLNIRLLLWFAAGGVVGSWFGAHIGLSISDMLQGGLLGALTCFVAWWMRKPKPEPVHREQTRCQCAKTFFVGISLGIITGMLGVGGGFLMVPVLLWLGIVDFRLAVAHSLLLIAVNATVAGLGYINEVNMQLKPLFIIAVLAMAGGLLGNKLLHVWSPKYLQAVFSVLLLCVGLFMLLGAAQDYFT